ncbi:hypothetical protein [Leptolyngbya sp. 7M]|uniref:hypothetical protein n=1 Tax=Leptolyngbya sp. 7M TaxID=2812896 RepID=UPI001B8AC9C0|nr:hypothetical protein [Leptolyngbya sp. 7M]QYO67433.1 hypothetical protein JVX88_11940 [Leptolyngbya sp. 7M]
MNKIILVIFAAAIFTFMTFGANEQNSDKIDLKIGEAKLVGDAGYSLHFLEVAEDSRCPDGVDCIWAGRAVVKLVLVKEDQPLSEFHLEDSGEKNVFEVDGFRFKLVSLFPKPTADGQPKQDEYTASISIEKLK